MQPVVVTTTHQGVFFGYVVDDYADTSTIKLSNARSALVSGHARSTGVGVPGSVKHLPDIAGGAIDRTPGCLGSRRGVQ